MSYFISNVTEAAVFTENDVPGEMGNRGFSFIMRLTTILNYEGVANEIVFYLKLNGFKLGTGLIT